MHEGRGGVDARLEFQEPRAAAASMALVETARNDFLLNAGWVTLKGFPAALQIERVELVMCLVDRHSRLPSPFPSTDHRQSHNVVAVSQPQAADGVLQLELEAGRRPNAALRRERAAKHDRSVRERARAGIALDQLLRRSHRRDTALLIKHARALRRGPGAQNELVPM